jgi:hypothetical protein
MFNTSHADMLLKWNAVSYQAEFVNSACDCPQQCALSHAVPFCSQPHGSSMRDTVVRGYVPSSKQQRLGTCHAKNEISRGRDP